MVATETVLCQSTVVIWVARMACHRPFLCTRLHLRIIGICAAITGQLWLESLRWVVLLCAWARPSSARVLSLTWRDLQAFSITITHAWSDWLLQIFCRSFMISCWNSILILRQPIVRKSRVSLIVWNLRVLLFTLARALLVQSAALKQVIWMLISWADLGDVALLFVSVVVALLEWVVRTTHHLTSSCCISATIHVESK